MSYSTHLVALVGQYADFLISGAHYFHSDLEYSEQKCSHKAENPRYHCFRPFLFMHFESCLSEYF